jgi:cyanate lyase
MQKPVIAAKFYREKALREEEAELVRAERDIKEAERRVEILKVYREAVKWKIMELERE